jgi:hypothetical protein
MAGLFWIYFLFQNQATTEIVKFGIDLFVVEILFLISFITHFKNTIFWNALFSLIGICLFFFLIFLSGNLYIFSGYLFLNIIFFSSINFFFIESALIHSVFFTFLEKKIKTIMLVAPTFLMFLYFFSVAEKITSLKEILVPSLFFCLYLFRKMSEGELRLWRDEMVEFIALIISFPIATLLYFLFGGKSIFGENVLHFYALLFYSTLFLLYFFDKKLVFSIPTNDRKTISGMIKPN